MLLFCSQKHFEYIFLWQADRILSSLSMDGRINEAISHDLMTLGGKDDSLDGDPSAMNSTQVCNLLDVHTQISRSSVHARMHYPRRLVKFSLQIIPTKSLVRFTFIYTPKVMFTFFKLWTPNKYNVNSLLKCIFVNNNQLKIYIGPSRFANLFRMDLMVFVILMQSSNIIYLLIAFYPEVAWSLLQVKTNNNNNNNNALYFINDKCWNAHNMLQSKVHVIQKSVQTAQHAG